MRRLVLKNPPEAKPVSKKVLDDNRAFVLGLRRRLNGAKSGAGMEPRDGGVVAELEGKGCVVLKREWIRSPSP